MRIYFFENPSADQYSWKLHITKPSYLVFFWNSPIAYTYCSSRFRPVNRIFVIKLAFLINLSFSTLQKSEDKYLNTKRTISHEIKSTFYQRLSLKQRKRFLSFKGISLQQIKQIFWKMRVHFNFPFYF